MYEKGGRKFGFVNVEPLGCIPFVKILDQGSNGSCFEEATALAELHNRELSLALQELERQLKGFKYTNFNFYSSLSERINDPSKYGMSTYHLPHHSYVKMFKPYSKISLCFVGLKVSTR